MAINPFSIRAAINEGAGYATSPLGATEFVGDVFDASASHMAGIMAEAAVITSDCFIAQEMMTEAAFQGNSGLELMDEAATGNMFTKVKEFFKKVIENIKGIIQKIKAFFMQLTGKTDKWLSIMKPRVNKATSMSGAGDVSYSMYEWDTSFVTSKMSTKVFGVTKIADKLTEEHVSMMADYIARVDANKKAIEADTEGKYDAHKKMYNKVTEELDTDRALYHNTLKSNSSVTEKELEELNTTLEEVDDYAYDKLSTELNYTNLKSASDVASELTKEARGDSDAKKDVKVSSKASLWLTVIEDSVKTRESLVKAYDVHLKSLEKVRKDLDKQASKVDKDQATARKSAVGDVAVAQNARAAEYTRKSIQCVTRMVTIGESALNAAKDTNLKCLKEMTSQYMGALTHLCNKVKA